MAGPRWDKKTYRRHMFNVGRGVRSPHEGTNTKEDYHVDWSWKNIGRIPWVPNLNAQKEYEQFTMPEATWEHFDATDRENFRKQDRKEVRQLFSDALKAHHFSKSKKLTRGQLDRIVDAYMSQDDEKFKKTMADMGFRGKDVDRWRRAAEESAETAIEGKAAVDRWDDDDYTASSTTGDAGQAASGNGGSPAGTGVDTSRGAPKAPAGTSQQPPLRPRADITTTTPRGPSDSGVRVDNVPVGATDTATLNQVKEIAEEKATADAVAAVEARRDAQSRASTGEERREIERQEEKQKLAERFGQLQDKRAAAIEEKRKARMNGRYAARKLSNEDDWKNLSRESSKKVGADDERVTDLLDRFARMSDKTLVRKGETAKWKNGKMVVRDDKGKEIDASKRTTTGVGDDGLSYANAFYAYNPNRQADLERLRKLVEQGRKAGTLTEEQLEATVARLDKWDKGAADRQAEQAARAKWKQGMEASKLREQYGMSSDRYGDEEVLQHHKDVQAARRKEILGRMAKGGASANIQNYGAEWQNLLGTGFDPGETFDKAMANNATKQKYDAEVLKIDSDTSLTPQAQEELRDQLRHRTIMNQAFADAGLGTGAEAADIGAIRQERQAGFGESNDYQTTVQQNVAAETAPLAQPPAVPPLDPRKEKDTMQLALGGQVLRPRNRRS